MTTRHGKGASRVTSGRGAKRRYVRREASARTLLIRGRKGDVPVRKDASGRTVSISERMLDNLADGAELGRRLADPESQARIPWSETRARLGL